MRLCWSSFTILVNRHHHRYASLSCQRCINFRATSYQPAIIHLSSFIFQSFIILLTSIHPLPLSCFVAVVPNLFIYPHIIESTHLFFGLPHDCLALLSSFLRRASPPLLPLLRRVSTFINKSTHLFVVCIIHLLVIMKLSRLTITIVSLCCHRSFKVPPLHHYCSSEESPPYFTATWHSSPSINFSSRQHHFSRTTASITSSNLVLSVHIILHSAPLSVGYCIIRSCDSPPLHEIADIV